MSSQEFTPPEEMDRDELETEVTETRETIDLLLEQNEALEQKFNRLAAVQTRMINELNGDVIGDTGEIDTGTTIDDPAYVAHGGQAVENLLDVRDRVETVEDTVNRHESQIQSEQSITGDRQTTNWQKVVNYSQNVDGTVEKNTILGTWVMLFKDDIASATGLSERRARQLMDEWAPEGSHEKQGTRLRPYQPPTEANRGNAKQKALKVDLSVWGEDE